jgi:hypothetical protein
LWATTPVLVLVRPHTIDATGLAHTVNQEFFGRIPVRAPSELW